MEYAARQPEPTTEDRGSLRAEMERIAKSVVALHDVIDSLAEQLAPVLAQERPQPTSDEGPGLDVVSPHCSLVNEAVNLQAGLNGAVRRIRAIQDRIET